MVGSNAVHSCRVRCYRGDMARSTQLAARIADQLGETPSRIQSWIERGYGPAGDSDLVEHFRHVAPYMGEGRDGDVAVLKAAADDYPCRRLREVLAQLASCDGPDATDPEELVEHFMADETVSDLRTLWTEMAADTPVPEWTAGNFPEAAMPRAERADVLARSAAYALADLTMDAPLTPEDYAEVYGLTEAAAATGEAFDDDAGQIVAGLFSFVRGLARTSRTWIETATPGELARGVAAARVLTEARIAAVPAPAWSDEAKWRRIGLMASVAGPLLHVIWTAAGMVPAGTVAPPAVRTYMDALRGMHADSQSPSPGRPYQR